ncbi:MAG: hypothetical protein ACXACY_14190 [Candidatus Hodarchaeales archaeon]|jgi:predicted transcriptional regulator
MNKKKEDNTSAEASNKQKKKGRLDGMLEAMNKRSDPLTTHRVATEYFSSFRSERNITKPQISEQIQPVNEDTTAVSSAVTTAVTDQSADKKSLKLDSLSITHTNSENKVYNAIKNELLNSASEEIRIGLTRLKELTGLSDKTIRVAIKSLEKKRSLVITESSKGVYGRKYFLPSPPDVIQKRLELGIKIDQTSKHILPR